MAVKAAELEAELIDTVCARLRERLGEGQAARCEAFVRQYYHWVPAADLTGRSPLDLYGAALTHWNLLQHRAPGQIKVHVYNPDFEHHGWQSPHTVAEIVTDDMPFLVDSVTMELARAGYAIDLVIHPVIRVRRDPEGNVIDVLEPGAEAGDAVAESVLHAEVAREPDRELLDRLHQSLERVLGEVNAAVVDWHAMRGRAESLIGELDEHEPPIDSGEVQDATEFLAWLADNHFTFLGYREYELVQREDRTGLQAIAESGLGILRGQPRTPYTELSPKALTLARAPHVLVLTKANSRSTVHRPAYLDYVGVKKFGADGEVTGERRFLGLYTTTAYKASPREIPLLRGKVGQILARAGFPPDSHDAKALLEILESYPRDSLFQAEVDDLFEVAMGILSLGERQRVRLFVLRDALDRFVECLVCIPRDRFNTENRERVARILIDAFGGTHVDWTLQLSESLLARVRYIVHSEQGVPHDYDVAEIEARLVRATRAWTDDLRAALIEVHGEDRGSKVHRRYERAFPPAYRDDWVARSAVADIARIEDLSGADEPIMSLYRPLEAPEGMVRCKLFSTGGVSLSDVLPTFEHMGARVSSTSARTRFPRRTATRSGSMTSDCSAWRTTSIGSAACSRMRSSASGAATWRMTASTRWFSAQLSPESRSRSSARSRSTCVKPGSRSQTRIWSGRCSLTPLSRGCSWPCSRCGLTLSAAIQRRPSDSCRRSKLRSTRSTASMRTGSCAAFCR